MFDQKDLLQAENLMRVLKNGKWELQFEEVLAFGQMTHWLASLTLRIKDDLRTQANIVSSAKPVKKPKSKA